MAAQVRASLGMERNRCRVGISKGLAGADRSLTHQQRVLARVVATDERDFARGRLQLLISKTDRRAKFSEINRLV
jgi:hypothetical protein